MDRNSIQSEMMVCNNRQDQCLQEIRVNAKKLETVIVANERIQKKYNEFVGENNRKVIRIKTLSKTVFNTDMVVGLQESICKTYQGNDFTNAVNGYENMIHKMNWCREKLEEEREQLRMELRTLQQRMEYLGYQLQALQEE